MSLIIVLKPGSMFFSPPPPARANRSEEHTSELQSLMRKSYAGFCLKKKQHDSNICRPADQRNRYQDISLLRIDVQRISKTCHRHTDQKTKILTHRNQQEYTLTRNTKQ